MSDIEQKQAGTPSWTEDDMYETGKWTLEDNLAYGIVNRYFFVEGFFAGKWADGKHEGSSVLRCTAQRGDREVGVHRSSGRIRPALQ